MIGSNAALPPGASAVTAIGSAIWDSAGRVEWFDHVVIAAHADQALAMLDDRSLAESVDPRRLPLEQETAHLHSDPSLMPKRRGVWSSWNYIGQPSPGTAANGCTVTYWMNRLQNISPIAAVCNAQSAARTRPPHRVCRRRLRPSVVRSGAIRAQRALWSLQGEAIPGSAAHISVPASTRTACNRASPLPRRSAACGVLGMSPTSRGGSISPLRSQRRRGWSGGMTENSALYVGTVVHRRLQPGDRTSATYGVLDAARPRRDRRVAKSPAAVFARPVQRDELLRHRSRRPDAGAASASGRTPHRRRRHRSMAARSGFLHAADLRLRFQSPEHLLSATAATERSRPCSTKSATPSASATAISFPRIDGRRGHPSDLRQTLLRIAIHGHGHVLRFSGGSAIGHGEHRDFRARRGRAR